MKLTYIEAIAKFYPGVSVWCQGDGTDFDALNFDDPGVVIDKADLDTKIDAEWRLAVWRLIQAERDRRKYGGVQLNGYWFHSDDASRIQHIGLRLLGSSMPTGVMWKTMSGAFVEMTPTLAMQIFTTIADNDINIFAIAEQYKAQMMAAEDPESIVFSTGWPAIYGE